jgi:hypothetical protein
MSAPAVIPVTKITASDIQFAEPRRNKNGGVSVGLKYNSQNVQFRIPKVSFPGGLQVKENPNKDGSVDTSYTMSASLNGGDPYGLAVSTETSETAKLYNFLFELQERLIQTAVERSPQWFGKKRSEDSVRDSFNKFISLSVDKTADGVWTPNGKYPPSLRLKLPVYDGKVAMEIVDSEDNDVPLKPDTLASVFSKGTSANLILQAQVYMVGQSFGVTWKPMFGQVFQRARQSARELFKRDVDEVKEDEDGEEVEADDAEAEVEAQPEAQAPVPIPVAAAAASGGGGAGGDAKPARRRKVA